ncbi:thioredoxin [Salinarchaeum laminariae]|uniref:thioredoxin n=1 Tax=Salinarchaeum laminariae TaxID=869888 RepID=UPI0020BD5221|nr:thioredoxin [Salinarchaeum laminariae]
MTTDTATNQSAETNDAPVAVNGQNDLEELVDQGGVVLADFYADWCGPCQMIAPVVEELAAETEATVAKIDVDANQPLAAAYGVRGVPTLVLFAEGEQVEEIVGVQSKDQLASLIDRYTN